MIIANIFTLKKINLGPEFNIFSSMDENIDKELPLLIIGYENAKEMFGELNIMDKQIDKNTFWTFERFADRMIYERDLEEFIKFSFKNVLKKIKYVDVDIIQIKKNKLFKIVKKLLTINNTITYKNKNDVYYILYENIIFGIDLNTISFFGYDKERIHNKIIDKSSVFLEGDEILIEYNDIMELLNYDNKYIPFLYSLKSNV